ncbi:hypothetical protein BVRB_9g225110 [Beta vulgaris subsp. vulgaris]|uniref:Steroid nuclear receptor ligand-binding n=1 Tax=Beta vulgaris subsp. vulgaris TaxID=3555 RepID=A0A0J8B9C5_BETVV|nr:uncharacterized membrane protein At3g27390 [Beta vulgaris subsp. vulgaris]KMS96457.1 hypothetical protein BVRB_9g225110 [Beta vulgaris subsp. vulgaris]
MKVPVGFIANLWSFIKFLPFFILLLILGIFKALIISPVAAVIISVGNSSVIIGLWPAHFIWTCYCVVRTKRLGMTLKIGTLLFLPMPLVLWPFAGILGSFVGGIGFGFFSPLIATFEAVGENVPDKCYHCVADGCWPTIQASCTVVRDFTDFCFHSYFSYMDELIMKTPAEEEPVEIKLSRLPGCLLVSLLALLVDVPSITVLALWKSPYMLITGWKRLLEDFIGREGPFLETVCVPFGGLAIILWPLAVIGSVVAAFMSSFFLGVYAGVVVHQEHSLRMGLAYIVAVVSLFDEYANDLLYLEPGSRLPRPRYRRNANSSPDSIQRKTSHESENNVEKDGREGLGDSTLTSQRSRTLKAAIQHYKPIKLLDWLFKSCEVNGRKLLHEGLINVQDIRDCVVKGDCKKLGTALPAWCLMRCLLVSAKSDSPGLVVPDESDLTITNWPRDKMFLWFIEPLLIMKEQIRKLNLEENEEACLQRAIMQSKNQIPEDWDDIGFPSEDNIRRAQLQSIIRRLQGIVGSMSRMPTFRRRFQHLVRVLYMEAAKTGALVNYIVDNSTRRDASDSQESDEASEESDAGKTEYSVANIV